MSECIDGKHHDFFLKDVYFPCPSFDIFVCFCDFLPDGDAKRTIILLVCRIFLPKFTNQFLHEKRRIEVAFFL